MKGEGKLVKKMQNEISYTVLLIDRPYENVWWMEPERVEENTSANGIQKKFQELVLATQESSLPGPGRLPRRLNLEGELMALGLIASARDWNEPPRGRW